MKILRINISYGEAEIQDDGHRVFTPEITRIIDIASTGDDVLAEDFRPEVQRSVAGVCDLIRKIHGAS